jgi:hypothetical protein
MDEYQTFGRQKATDEFFLKVVFGGRYSFLTGPAHGGAFKEQRVNVGGWMGNQLVYQPVFAAVRPEISAIEKALAVSFDQQSVGIVGRVIDEKRRDAKRPYSYWLPINQVWA